MWAGITFYKVLKYYILILNLKTVNTEMMTQLLSLRKSLIYHSLKISELLSAVWLLSTPLSSLLILVDSCHTNASA